MKPVLLSTEEKERFEQDDFLIIPEAIPKSLQCDLGNAIEQLVAADPNSPCNESDILGLDSSFLELIDLPTAFPKILELLGWNIWVNHSRFTFSPTEVETDAPTDYKSVTQFL